MSPALIFWLGMACELALVLALMLIVPRIAMLEKPEWMDEL